MFKTLNPFSAFNRKQILCDAGVLVRRRSAS